MSLTGYMHGFRAPWLIFFLALTLGACARLPEAPPREVTWEEKEGCDQDKLRRELAALEEKVATSPGERANLLIRLARICFILGELSPKGEKNHYFAKGREYAEILSREHPEWADGHYWLGLNLCGLAEVAGAKRGLKMVPQIIEAMERALRVDPVYDQAGPHRVLGRIYFECPAWPLSVGDIHQSLRHLSKAAAIAPENSTNHLFLAETLLKLGKKPEAREELEKVLKATRHAVCAKELEEDRRQALRLLRENYRGQAVSPDLPGVATAPPEKAQLRRKAHKSKTPAGEVF